MNNKFDKEQKASQALHESPCRGLELTKQQSEIHGNLKSIGPEIAAYYLDGLKILYGKDLEAAASFLAHAAREIDGSLRNILSIEKKEELEFVIRMPNGETLTEEKGKEGTLKFVVDAPGNVKVRYRQIGKHKPSILQSLGVDELSPLAGRWIEVTGKFYKFVHRHGAWKPPHSIADFEPTWHEFEDVLASLVGSYLNLLSKVVDRILEFEEPTEEIRGILPYLLESETRRKYFFGKLESAAWLEPLKNDRWFNPEENPALIENPEQPGNFYYPIWHALEYVAKISTHSETDISVLVNIVNSIIKYTDEGRERIENDRTDLQIIKIIGTFPTDRIEPQHIAFMSTVLKSKSKYGTVDEEIDSTILPKLLDGDERELTLALLTIILEVRATDGQIRPIMDEYWLENTLKEHGQAIANLCGFEAAQIALAQIRMLTTADEFAFHFIQFVESDLSLLSHADYMELVVSFTSCVFQFAEPDNIKETVQVLLNEPHTIIKRIAVKTINHHYSDLKHLFWEWEGNPLDEIELKPEMYELIQTNSHAFSEGEMEQILQWIESTRD